MDDDMLRNLYDLDQIKISEIKTDANIGNITEKDRFDTAKRILIAIAILYVFTLCAFVYTRADDVLDLCRTAMPPIVTLIIGYYFRNRSP